MKNKIRRFPAAVLTVILLCSMSVAPAYAEATEQEIEPGEDTIVTGENNSEHSATEAPAVSSVDYEETQIESNPVILSANAEDEQREAISGGGKGADTSAESGGEATDISEPSAPAPVVTVGGVELKDSAVDSGWSDSSGWRYDTKSISIVNNSSPIVIHAENAGVDLSVAGLNHIDTLYADGDVNITGSGILLVDNIDMLEGTNINLLTNTDIYADGTGSVALFVYNAEDGAYYLKNGDVTGILDEVYTLPNGIHLVVPENSKLELRVIDEILDITFDKDNILQKTEHVHFGVSDSEQNYDAFHNPNNITHNADGTTTERTLAPNFSALTISEGSSLTIESGAVLKMDSTDYKRVAYDSFRDVVTVVVKGILNLWGRITGTRENENVPEVVVEGNGAVNGDGVFQDLNIHVKTEQSGGNDAIHTTGKVSVLVDKWAPTIDAGGDLHVIFMDDAAAEGIICSDPENTSIRLSSSNYLIPVELESDPGALMDSISAPYRRVLVNGSMVGVDAESAAQICKERSGSEKWTVPVTMENENAIIKKHDTKYTFSEENTYNKANKGNLELTPNTGTNGDGFVDYDFLWSKLANGTSEYTDHDKNFIVYRVIALQDNKVVPIFLYDGKDITVPAMSVLEIGVINVFASAAIGPASGVSGTNGQNTGSGILGGANAGSFNGGSSTSILSGSRKPTPSQPVTVPTPDEDEPEDTENQQKPESPDEVKPAEEGDENYLTYKVSGVGNTYTLDAFKGGNRITDITGGELSVSFRVDLPAEYSGHSIFVVFYKENGEMLVYRAYYSADTGMLSFDTAVLGSFNIVMLDWDSADLSSPAFFSAVKEALAKQ